MPPIERDVSMEPRGALRHKHSASSDHGKALIIPMWDSSDPDRAPPPLPLNPQSPSIGCSRPGTSTAIQTAHAALTEKARESMAASPLLTKRLSEVSPERPLPRPNPHRRMQSLQPSTIRDRGFFIEGVPSSPGSPEKSTRPSTPIRHRDSFSQSPDKMSEKMGTPGPGPSLTPIVRPTAIRRHQQSILGENTPPQSATMLALQNMQTPSTTQSPIQQQTPAPKEAETPLSNVTNNSTAITKSVPNFDPTDLANQLLTLTNIATSLQKEMSALSRRSRDNATDLMSLKQATNSRDEDIRKTLRDLIGNLNDPTKPSIKDPFYSGLLIDSKPHYNMSSPSSSVRTTGRPFSLPRIPSPNSFATSLDRESVGTPSFSAADAPATIALLEKIIRDMGTREGQDLLITRLTEVSEKLAGMASAAKVEELMDHLKQSERVMMPMANNVGGGPPSLRGLGLGLKEGSNSSMTLTFDGVTRGGAGSQQREPIKAPASDLVSEDILKIIRSVKDSVSQGGGLTAEVKALVRELRGEVLGMGRELRRRLDEVAFKDEGQDKSVEQKKEMKRIVNEGLDELKDHMDELLREHRRQSGSSTTSRATAVDYQEIYNAMRAALKDSQAGKPQQQGPTRDDVIDAVREAWENYKPEIEVQQFGLERDEILACLKEGLQSHAPRDDQPVGATREEVFRAVVEGLKHFVPPRMETPASLSRDEILDAVRECLEEFEFPVAPSAIGNDLSRDDMVQAVKEGLHGFEFPNNSQALTLAQPSSDFIMTKLSEIVELMRHEFRAVSEEAKENVAANGRDTEQVLDATKDGFEKLRMDMETFVSRVSGLAGKTDATEVLLKRLEALRDEVSHILSSQIEGLRDAVNMSLVPFTSSQRDNPSKEALNSLKEGVDRIRSELQRPLPGTGEILDAIHEGVSELHIRLEKLTNKPPDLTANDEILDALKSGLDSVRSDIDNIRETNDRAVTQFSENANALVPTDEMLKHDDIKNLEVLITQLRIKVEAMETAPPPDTVSRDDLTRMEEMMTTVKEAVEGLQAAKETTRGEAPTDEPDTTLKEDVQAIETILRNTKARLDDLIDGETSVRKEHIDSLETLILETRETLSSVSTQMENTSRKEDVTMLESLISHVAAAYDEMKERADKELENPEKVTRTDIEAVEAVCIDVKALVTEISNSGLSSLPSKEELTTMVTDLKDRVDALSEAHSKSMEERQTEVAEVSERVNEVKAFLTEFQDMTKSRLADGVVGVETVGKLLEKMGETINNNATVGEDLREMFEAMKVEFEESRAGVVGVKLDADEKFQATTEALSSKIDERVDELVAKYDEFQTTMEERAKAGEARDEETEAAVMGTKAVAEELKLLIDTLGSTVTESLEKMEEASKTVFDRVEELVNRTDENHNDDKAQHEQTRDQVQQAIAAVEGLHAPVQEIQPKLLEAMGDILTLVGQHYDYAKTATTNIQDKIEEAKPEPLMLPDIPKYDDACVQEKLDKLIEGKYDDTPVQEKLDKLMEKEYDDSGVREKLDKIMEKEYDDSLVHEKLDKIMENKYDDSNVHEKLDRLITERYDDILVQEKLDRLVDHTHAATQAYGQLDTLDKIHSEVIKTAAGISEFLAAQTQRITDEHEDREKTLQETTIALERKTTEKEQVEATLASLRAEEERLRQSVLGLKDEQDSLTKQKTRLTADVSSLETALRLRKEELNEMEERAEGLERRILEGVMNHSRVLLMSKQSKGSDAMSRKRVRIKGESVQAGNSAKAEQQPSKPTVPIALASKRSLNSNKTGGASRRIVSLSQITHNVPAGGFKRSHSVKAPSGVGRGGMRKGSWGGSLNKKYGELDKENVVEPVKEGDEDDDEIDPHGGELVVRRRDIPLPTESALSTGSTLNGGDDEIDDDDDEHSFDDGEVSDAGTLRRSSRGTTIISSTTGSGDYSDEDSYDSDYDSRSEWTESAVGSTLSDAAVAGNEIVLLQP
ncbi:hypothetical protein jhhlp_001262 [Lomentospora prolificans]|uniref:Uncharacterized protein n=1 Tax=Lomentospora prolificans TaxID=41688 RepID=A0A2N3NHM7_9PEZI|nr:hypothetical protein jhhlp_001262 [Lomentospora prolificans]